MLSDDWRCNYEHSLYRNQNIRHVGIDETMFVSLFHIGQDGWSGQLWHVHHIVVQHTLCLTIFCIMIQLVILSTIRVATAAIAFAVGVQRNKRSWSNGLTPHSLTHSLTIHHQLITNSNSSSIHRPSQSPTGWACSPWLGCLCSWLCCLLLVLLVLVLLIWFFFFWIDLWASFLASCFFCFVFLFFVCDFIGWCSFIQVNPSIHIHPSIHQLSIQMKWLEESHLNVSELKWARWEEDIKWGVSFSQQ